MFRRSRGSEFLSDKCLEELHLEAIRALSDPLGPSVTATTLFELVTELLDAREEIARLQMFESVESILAEELDDGLRNNTGVNWDEDKYTFDPPVMTATSTSETQLLPRVTEDGETDPAFEGRRLPRLGK